MHWLSIARPVCAAMIVLATACTVSPPPPARPAQISPLYLVAHPSSRIVLGQVRDLYLGQLADAEGTFIPVDNAASQGDFLRRHLGMDLARYEKLRARQSYRDGREPPLRLPDDAAVLQFVARTPGAVGYVRRPGPGVRVVTGLAP